MQNSIIKKMMTLVCILLLQPMMTPDSFAWAKRRRPPKAYSFIAEGGKASQGECDGERKIPRRLKRLKEFAKTNSYMGSELQEPELKGKIDGEMWKHFFRVKGSCNSILAKTPSALEEPQKNSKVELPPEEDEESDSESGAETESETESEAEAEADKEADPTAKPSPTETSSEE